MTDGIYVDGRRPKTKKELKQAVKDGRRVEIDCTSMFGGFSGDILNAPVGEAFYIVGPDPHTSRKWYASIANMGNGQVKVS